MINMMNISTEEELKEPYEGTIMGEVNRIDSALFEKLLTEIQILNMKLEVLENLEIEVKK